MAELLCWSRLSGLGPLFDRVSRRGIRTNGASNSMETEMDDLVLLLPRPEV